MAVSQQHYAWPRSAHSFWEPGTGSQTAAAPQAWKAPGLMSHPGGASCGLCARRTLGRCGSLRSGPGATACGRGIEPQHSQIYSPNPRFWHRLSAAGFPPLAFLTRTKRVHARGPAGRPLAPCAQPAAVWRPQRGKGSLGRFSGPRLAEMCRNLCLIPETASFAGRAESRPKIIRPASVHTRPATMWVG